MTEQAKQVVRELNSALGTKLDLIKLDALDDARRLQLLLDLLAHYGAGPKMEVGSEEPEALSVQLLDMLGRVKYRPPAAAAADPPAFRAALLAADRDLLHAILAWLVANKQQVTNNAYLARYLKAPEIPAAVSRAGGVAELLDAHHQLAQEFKEVHRRTRSLAAEGGAGAEMAEDIKEMAVERDIVLKRLESAQASLPDAAEREQLLAAAERLRLQQQRAEELAHQAESQESQLKTVSDQLKRHLNSLYGQSSAPKTPDDIIKHLREEIQLNEYMVKEKLPAEERGVERELSALRRAEAEPAPARAALVKLQEQISEVNSEIETMVSERLASRQPAEDKLKPFRQQAALIRRNKEAAAERARALSDQLRRHEAALAALHAQVRQLLGDTVLRGEELKKYVNSLRTKSVLYKRQRANLSSFKVEAGILTRTLYILSNSDPTVEVALLNHKKLEVEEPPEKNDDTVDLNKSSLRDLSQLVAQTAQQLAEVRQEMQPLVEKIQPVRTRFQAVQQQYEHKKRVYEDTSINITSQMEPLKDKLQNLREQLNRKEDEWKNIRQRITKAEDLQQVISAELRNSMQSPRKPSKIETLQKKIAELEETIRDLEEQQESASRRAGVAEQQAGHWERLARLLDSKAEAAEALRSAARAARARLTLTEQSQTLVLQ